MEFKKLHKKVSLYWTIKRLLFLSILAIGYIIGINNVEAEFRLLVIIPGGVLLLWILIYATIFPSLQRKVYQYYLDDEKIIISFGVLFRNYRVIPIVQIQDIGSFQGPIQIGFKLSTITISTAGSNVAIKCVDYLLARDIVTDIQKKIHQRLQREDSDEALS